MTRSTLDLSVNALYAAVILTVGLRAGRKASGAKGYTEIFTMITL